MTYEEFSAWIVERRRCESLRAIGESLGKSAQTVLRWTREGDKPEVAVLRLATLLAPEIVMPGLPQRKPKRKR